MTEEALPGAPIPNFARVAFGASGHTGAGDINQAGRDLVQYFHAGAIDSVPLPRQLPAGTSDFVGRETQLAQLTSLLTSRDGNSAKAIAVVGTAGVGKTALALHWAHNTRNRYADGDLYVNLRGYDTEGPADPSEVLDSFLRAFGIPADKVPRDRAAREGMYRAVLAARRMLIVLDNAGTASQVRPLLPGSRSCAVLITSRSRLTGLSIRDGVPSVNLELLPPNEAVVLLTRLVGHRAADDPEETAELARLCAYLPLAIRIVAERARFRPGVRVREIVAELRASNDRLDFFAVEDDELTSVRAVFSWSYQSLHPTTAKLFRLIGLHPGPDISPAAAAALSDSTLTETRRRLDALSSVHLVDPLEGDRYQLHDLLKVYAAERAHFEVPAGDAFMAQSRELDWYLYSVSNADLLLNPNRRRVVSDALDTDWSPPLFATREEALRWCELERANCVAMVRRAAEIGAHDVGWRLSIALNSFFYLRWHLADWTTTASIGVASARRLHDQFAKAWSLTGLGGAHEMALDWVQVLECYEKALELWRECGDQLGEMLALQNLGNAYREVGRLDESLSFEMACLAISEDTSDKRIEGLALQGLGKTYSTMANFEEAITCFQRALEANKQAKDKHTEGRTLSQLADVYGQRELDSEALATYQRALTVQRSIGDQRGEADTLMGLGAVEMRSGHQAAATDCWRSARDIFSALNEPLLSIRAEFLLREFDSQSREQTDDD